MGEGRELGGCGEPASEVGFEGALVNVAFTRSFAAFVHNTFVEEYGGSVEEAGYVFFPDCAAICLVLLLVLKVAEERGDLRSCT